jgi:aldehyde dehydrogenase (NAD+)
LTPCTLELGGKSPVIIDKSAKIQTAIERVSAAKWLNVGQICVAPDYVLVHKDREQEFIDGMKKKINVAFGENPKDSPHFGRVINGNHVRRINELLSKTQGTVVAGGAEAVDPDSRYFPPTLVKDAKMGEPLLTEEIFGPVLPILSVDSMEDAVNKVNTICDRPLALYVYSEDKAATNTVLNGTLSGGVGVNTSLEQLSNNNLPFGGVGGSGYGAYHGKAGFDEFSHRRSVLKQDTLLMKGASFPDKPSDQMFDMAVKMMVTGFLTEQQRQVVKVGLTAGAVVLAGAALRSRL